ncbi:uncharacterized protein BcabD6B2_51020 [Babesia caballi]|uniref:Uncharacterized protein n=1 Tax=Babesia caballi TaxID=5871 RepID=A0AAV4M194_BABCB|nr:hypothetical protein BcabD6B2_51020 [Babesia caballi]
MKPARLELCAVLRLPLGAGTPAAENRLSSRPVVPRASRSAAPLGHVAVHLVEVLDGVGAQQVVVRQDALARVGVRVPVYASGDADEVLDDEHELRVGELVEAAEKQRGSAECDGVLRPEWGVGVKEELERADDDGVQRVELAPRSGHGLGPRQGPASRLHQQRKAPGAGGEDAPQLRLHEGGDDHAGARRLALQVALDQGERRASKNAGDQLHERGERARISVAGGARRQGLLHELGQHLRQPRVGDAGQSFHEAYGDVLGLAAAHAVEEPERALVEHGAQDVDALVILHVAGCQNSRDGDVDGGVDLLGAVEPVHVQQQRGAPQPQTKHRKLHELDRFHGGRYLRGGDACLDSGLELKPGAAGAHELDEQHQQLAGGAGVHVVLVGVAVVAEVLHERVRHDGVDQALRDLSEKLSSGGAGGPSAAAAAAAGGARQHHGVQQLEPAVDDLLRTLRHALDEKIQDGAAVGGVGHENLEPGGGGHAQSLVGGLADAENEVGNKQVPAQHAGERENVAEVGGVASRENRRKNLPEAGVGDQRVEPPEHVLLNHAVHAHLDEAKDELQQQGEGPDARHVAEGELPVVGVDVDARVGPHEVVRAGIVAGVVPLRPVGPGDAVEGRLQHVGGGYAHDLRSVALLAEKRGLNLGAAAVGGVQPRAPRVSHAGVGLRLDSVEDQNLVQQVGQVGRERLHEDAAVLQGEEAAAVEGDDGEGADNVEDEGPGNEPQQRLLDDADVVEEVGLFGAEDAQNEAAPAEHLAERGAGLVDEAAEHVAFGQAEQAGDAAAVEVLGQDAVEGLDDVVEAVMQASFEEAADLQRDRVLAGGLRVQPGEERDHALREFAGEVDGHHVVLHDEAAVEPDDFVEAQPQQVAQGLETHAEGLSFVRQRGAQAFDDGVVAGLAGGADGAEKPTEVGHVAVESALAITIPRLPACNRGSLAVSRGAGASVTRMESRVLPVDCGYWDSRSVKTTSMTCLCCFGLRSGY